MGSYIPIIETLIMKVNFILTTTFTYEQTVDSETGEILNTKLIDKKVNIVDKIDQDDPTPTVLVEASKLVFNNAAINLMGVKVGTLMDVKYKMQDGKSIPVLGTADAFNVEGGNKLTKSKTLSFRGAKHETIIEYGTRFTLETTQRKGEFNLISQDKNLIVDDKVGIDEAKEWKLDNEEIENPDGLEADDSIFKF